jgi:hypothetical protein
MPLLRLLSLCWVGVLLASGCATPPLHRAREDFYAGHFDRAALSLGGRLPGDRERVLWLLERATARQAAGQYAESASDFLAAQAAAERLDYYSLSRGTASFAINDRVMAFRGAPYERGLLHAFCAQNYLALGMWDDAAVEARNLIHRLEDLDGFPDDAYGRYVAGLCLELSGDEQGASVQYRAVSDLLGDPAVDERTGTFRNAASDAALPVDAAAEPDAELVCLIGFGRIPPESGVWLPSVPWDSGAYAEIYCGTSRLGRSFLLSDTGELLAATAERRAALQHAKAATRIVLKEAVAEALGRDNPALGDLARLILFSLEVPDDRRWETLPLYLHAARVRCPRDLETFRLVCRSGQGDVWLDQTVTQPLARRRRTLVSFCRVL